MVAALRCMHTSACAHRLAGRKALHHDELHACPCPPARLPVIPCANPLTHTASLCPALQIGYEPYIMMHRDYVPFYDERFRGYYW